MGTIYRKSYTKPLPAEAEIFTRRGEKYARWKDGRDKRCQAKLSADGKKVIIESPVWYARYRDAEGIERRVSTRCRDEQAARNVLAIMVKESEKVKAGILSSQEAKMGKNAHRPLSEHIAAFITHLQAKGTTEKHQDTTKFHLELLAEDCTWRKLSDLSRVGLEKWLVQQTEQNMSARTRNSYRGSAVSFTRWAMRNNRLTHNPFSSISKASEKKDRRKQRRALTLEEAQRLLYTAQMRPLAEFGRETLKLPSEKRKGRKTWAKAPLSWEKLDEAVRTGRENLAGNPAYIDKLLRRGKEHYLVYKTMMLTGLRKNEVASLTVGVVLLDKDNPHIEILPSNEKAGRGARIPLRSDLAEELGDYIAQRRVDYQKKCASSGEAFRNRLSSDLPMNYPLFRHFPSIKTFDLDLNAAGIAKMDERGKTLDRHALRLSFGTYLSMAGVSPRIAQEAMRHSTIDLTMNVYTDPKLLDIAAAINSLPDFSLKKISSEKNLKTGTDNAGVCGAENGAVFGAERQEKRGIHGPSLSRERVNFDKQKPSQVLKKWEHRNTLTAVGTRRTNRARQDSNLQPSDSKSATLSN